MTEQPPPPIPLGAESTLYRILDANLDRAREGLRVLEDLARFALDDAELTERLKAVRHAVSVRDRDLAVRLLDARDASGDVGAAVNLASEFQRQDLLDLALANAKRLQEALRTVEEAAKTFPAGSPFDPAAFQAARFTAYEVETVLAGRLGRAALRGRIRDLYFILDPEICGGRDPLTVARAAIAGGVRVIQVRVKTRDKGAILRLTREVQDLCTPAGVLCIVNDHVDVAIAAEADGVHVGQQDLPVATARALMPIDRIVGCSTNNPAEAAAAVFDGADYVGVGAMFATGSKQNTRPAGPERIPAVRAVVNVPVIAIGGITSANVGDVIRAGADGAAVISAIGAAPDPEAATRQILAAMASARS